VPLLPLLAAFVGGCLVPVYLTGFTLLSGCLLLLLCCLCVLLRRWRQAMVSLFAVLGVSAMWLALPEEIGHAVPDRAYSGIVREVRESAYNKRIIADITFDGKPIGVLIRYHGDSPAVEPGDTVRFHAVLLPPDAESTVPGELSLARYAFRHGLSAVCHVKDGAMEVAAGAPAASCLWRWRRDFSDFVYYRSGLGAEASGLLEAVLAGNADAVPSDVREQFSRAGTAHVLALSGMHVAILTGVLSVVLLPLAMTGHRRVQMAATIIMLWCYVLFTGGAPSVVRAVIMATVIIGARMWRRGASPFNSLCLAALLILLFRPRDLFAPGFQLSFIAVVGILLFVFGLRGSMRLPGSVRWMADWLTVCVAAVLSIAPVAAWHFHLLPVLFLWANVPVGILLPVFMTGGAVLLLCRLAGLSADWLVWVVENCCRAITGWEEMVASSGFAAVDGIYFPWWVAVPYYAALLAGWYAIRSRRKVFGLGCILLLLFTAGCFRLTRPVFPMVEAYGMHCHHAAAILLKEGDRLTVLTDAAPKFHEGLRRSMTVRLKDYMGMRGIDSLTVSGNLRNSGAFYADSCQWAVGNTLILIAGKNALPDSLPAKPDYILVTSGFKGSVVALCRRYTPEMTVLSPAVYSAEASRMMSELDSAGISCRRGFDRLPLLHSQGFFPE